MLNRSNALTFAQRQTAIIRDPLVVSPHTLAIEAIAQMSGVLISYAEASKEFIDFPLENLHESISRAKSSCIIVVEHKRLVGILTERDVVRLIGQQQDLRVPISNLMSHPVISLQESKFTDLLSAVSLFQQHQIRHLPMLDDDDHLAGLLTQESLRQTSHPIDLLRLRLVNEVMTTEVIYSKDDVSILAIAALMTEQEVSCIVLIKERESLKIPVGIVTERDIVQFQALSLDWVNCPVQSVMSTPVFAISPQESLWAVHQIMQDKRIRRLAVTGSQGELLGIVTESNLLQALNPLELYKLAEVLEQKLIRLEVEKIELLEKRTLELEQEIERRTNTLKVKLERDQLLAKIAAEIRSSLSLQSILDTTVEQVRQVLGCDRTNIFRCEANGEMLIVAESTNSEISLIGERIQDSCFQQDWSEIYRQGHIRVVPDIYAIEMTDCHRELLIRLHTRAKMIVPLLCGDQLWGLLNATESEFARNWQPEEIELLELLSFQLAIALQQATTYEQLQQELIERQQTEEWLRHSKQQYASLVAASPVGIFRTDVSGLCIYANQRWCEIAGIPLEAILGDQLQQALHPDDRERVALERQKAVAENRPFKLEYRYLSPEGAVVWVYGQIVAEVDSNGKINGFLGTITDISDRKASEQALQIQRDFNRLIAEIIGRFVDVSPNDLNAEIQHTLDLIGEVTQVDTCYIFAYDEISRTTSMTNEWVKAGYPAQIGVAQNIPSWILFPWSSPLIMARETVYIHDVNDLPPAAAIDQANWQQLNLRSILMVPLVRKSVVTGAIGFATFGEVNTWGQESIRLLGVMGQTIADAQERAYDQQQLELLSDRLQEAQRIARIGNWEQNFSNGNLYWSDEVYRIFEITPNTKSTEGGLTELTLQVFQNAVHPEDREAVAQAFNNSVRNRTPYMIRHRILLANGQVKYVQEQAETIYAEDGSPILTRGTVQDITDLIHYELQLQELNTELEKRVAQRTAQLFERENQLNDFFDNANDLIQSVFLPDGRFEYVNQAWRETLGYSKAEVVKLTIFDVLHSHSQMPYREILRQMQAGILTKVDWVELVFLTKTQQEVIAEGSINCRMKDGVPVATRAIFRDVTDRRQAEQIIHQQANREKLLREVTQRIRKSLNLQTIFDTACLEIRHVLGANRVGVFKFYPESGFDDGEFVAESVVDGFPSVLAERVHDHTFGENYASLYAKGRYYVAEDIYENGQRECHVDILAKFQVRSNLVVPLLSADQLWGLLCIHQCASTRKWQQPEIDFTQQLANQLAIAIQQADLFQQVQQQLTERQLAEQQLTERNQQLAASNDELARATRLKDEFLANMSHELRTPLNAILGMTEGLQEQIFGNVSDRQIKALQTIERSASHLLELINDILDVAKIESGQIELDCTPTAIAPLCNSSLVFIKQQAQKKGIQVEMIVPPNLPDLVIDERRIRQVLINLLNNAVKFTPKGGRITLKASCKKLIIKPSQSPLQGITKVRVYKTLAEQELGIPPQEGSVEVRDSLRIAVSDTGIGIASENISKLFQPFVQIDSALNRQYAGTGLGLSLVKRIVEMHGGKVGLTSELGVGSCFTIDLPYPAPIVRVPIVTDEANYELDQVSDQFELPHGQSPLNNQQNIPENNQPIKQPLILLAEDNEANISTFTSYLKAKGYRITVAKNGEEAISLVQAETPDLILMDIQMPVMDGLEAIKHIREDLKLVDIHIIALTALTMPGDRERCLEAGANDYLAKPVKLKELTQMIQTLLTH
ncbi:PAS domain S-box [Synechococcus sp. PCC 7502]|uniref:GAF domain-containing protein n=1 Tax=Synechococcus sp. PCC 7502 TaxID=1173263 RepID=UPI00029FAF36|nr:GAF domain-containing protein [Synechococcus sp. PCC 7502]AFY73310.1 PAS domain S-box [Synechococcus sp. PCC 7502]